MGRNHSRLRTERVAALAVALIAGFFVLTPPSSADVSGVSGSAYGYLLNVSLFGGPVNTRGPEPTVTLPATGGHQEADVASTSAVIGPATFFTSGPITVTTHGTTGPTGSVTSTTDISNVNTSGDEVFTASAVSSTCTASESGVTGSTTITGGTLLLDSGNDTNGDGDFTDLGEHAPVQVTLPTQPAPNTTYTGHIHVNGAQDNFRYVFNEQVVNPDGSLTVYAAHQYLLGPTATGDLFIGKAECGVTVTAPTTTTTQPTSTTSSSTTTTQPTTTTSSSTTTTQPTTTTSSSTTTTQPTTTTSSSTTTTQPTTTTSSSTTTTQPTTTTSSSTSSTSTTSTSVPTGQTCMGLTPTIVGTSGDDNLRGTNGPDVIMGLGGDDMIVALGGNDVVCAGDGDDTVVGGTGNDILRGESGRDHLIGGPGDDELDGGPGEDKCTGSEGEDTRPRCEHRQS